MTTTTPQKKTGSGFGAGSTAAEVLDGTDLSGRLAIVTGGYSGLGLETARALAAAGAHVVVPARRPGAAREALRGVDGTEVAALDLADLASVRAFADAFLGSGRDVHLFIGNAAVMACPESRVGPGWEAQFATNHLGHFALVNRLWPAIRRGGGRVVAVSSSGHWLSGVRWEDPQFTTGYDKWQAYGQAKTANALFARHLDALAAGSGVRAFSAHPGGIMTPLQRHLTREEMRERGWINEAGEIIATGFKSPQAGAATQVWAATAPSLDGLGGVYCEDCDIADAAGDPADRRGVAPWATDDADAERLWALSARLTGVDAFA